MNNEVKKIVNFNDKSEFVKLLTSHGFEPFVPGHSSKNGYDIKVNDKGRRACFYDNRLWSDERIEFRIMDYGKMNIIKDWLFGLKTVTQETRYGIFSIYFDSVDEITSDKIELLIKVSRAIE